MPQYWLQTPVENAKEVVQRFIDANPSLTYYAGKKASYTLETEVIFYDLANNPIPYDANVIYFGTLVCASVDTSIRLGIRDGNNNSITTFTSVNNTNQIDPNVYPYIMCNRVIANPNSTAYFVGYKFTIA